VNFMPVFKSTFGDISHLQYVNGIGSLFVSTDQGALFRIDQFPSDSQGRGATAVYAQIQSGEGDLSSIVNSPLYYDLYNAVVQLTGSTDSFTVIQKDVRAYLGEKKTKVTAVYVSDVLKADEDFGFWKTITWKQNTTDGRVIVALKVADTLAELEALDWQYYISETSEATYTTSVGSEHVVLKDLDRFNLKGRFMQFKVELETEDSFEIPIVSEFVITYASKHSVFFFTRKFKVERNAGIDTIILTANYSVPTNTELRFGVANEQTGDWEDYTLVDLNQLVNLGSDWGDIVKVGIKLSSYSATAYPTVQEVAFLLGTESENEFNE